jgi:tetratricopeptide (TPR) repeat protein
MKTVRTYMFASLIALFTASGCATFQAASDVQSGRRAFLIGDNQTALGYFQRAAQITPNYVHYGTALQENVWSYVGRAEYAVGRLVQARRTLETDLRSNRDETASWLDGGQDMSRLYLGLTLIRSGERQHGLQEIENAMRGLYDDIEYVTQHHRFSFGQFWDPRREIRSSIEGDLAMLSRQDVNLQKLIADGEWLGQRLEEEIDQARRDEVDLLLEGH